MRNNKGDITESPSQMFERVALLVALADVLRDNSIFTKDGNVTQDVEQARSYLGKLDDFNYKFKIGEYYLNKWHFRGLIKLLH